LPGNEAFIYRADGYLVPRQATFVSVERREANPGSMVPWRQIVLL